MYSHALSSLSRSSHSCPSRYLVDRLMLIEISLHHLLLCLRADPLVHRLTFSRPTRSHHSWTCIHSPTLEVGVVRSSSSSIPIPLLLFFFGFALFSLFTAHHGSTHASQFSLLRVWTTVIPRCLFYLHTILWSLSVGYSAHLPEIRVCGLRAQLDS
jgi:hypothetical protein